jgi:hypothetical protein
VPEELEILEEISSVETIASGPSLRIRHLLEKVYGRGNWRKCKGYARVRLPDGFVGLAELHWYEAHGLGRFDFKVKRMLRRES